MHRIKLYHGGNFSSMNSVKDGGQESKHQNSSKFHRVKPLTVSDSGFCGFSSLRVSAMRILTREAHREVTRPHARSLMVIASLLVAVRMAWLGVATASTASLNFAHPQLQNQTKEIGQDQVEDFADTDRPMWMVRAELRMRQFQRRRLIRILNQFAEMRKHQRLVKELGSQGPDGSHLANQSVETLDAVATPPELAQLLAVEDRIRRLRHLRRILVAKEAAARSEQKLQAVRSPKRTILRLCGTSLGVCLVAKSGWRISQAVRTTAGPWDDMGTWLKGLGKCYADVQEGVQPWLGSFQPFIDYFWQASSRMRLWCLKKCRVFSCQRHGFGAAFNGE